MDNNEGNVFAWLLDKGKWGLTFVPKAIVDFAGHEDSVIDSATKIVHEATPNPLRNLIKGFLERFRGLIDNEISDRLLKVALGILTRISNNITPPVMLLLQQISDRSLELIISVSPQINPVRLLEVALGILTRISNNITPPVMPLLQQISDRSLELIISVSPQINPVRLLEVALGILTRISNNITPPVMPLLQQISDRSLELIISVSPQINPVRLLEVVLGILTRISNNITPPVMPLLQQISDRSLELIISVSPQINPVRLLEVALGILTRISNNITPPVMLLLQQISNRSLELIISVSNLIDSGILLKTAATLTWSILDAVIKNVGALRIIRDGILSNNVNPATVKLVWGNGEKLVNFFVGLVDCIKCYAKADSWNGAYPNDDPHGQDNELDLTKAMNRHAAICQFQRLAKSVLFILKRMAVNASLEDIDMSKQTILMGDVNLGTVINVPPSGRHPGEPLGPSAEQQTTPNEKWLFVNGIAGEYYWLYLACRKLAKRYSRDITGVFNRGDGILWDLVECAGERTDQGNGNAIEQSGIVKRTESSKAAQESLKDELERALNSKVEHVVMIAHSQGCLLLRLALQELLTYKDDEFKTRMKSGLSIFTFGNPSLDWKTNGPAATPLASHVHITEHFANETDFVADLGVLRAYNLPNSDTDTGYSKESVFVNRDEKWRGHLFGSQYSLNSDYYRDHRGPESRLLACGPGIPI